MLKRALYRGINSFMYAVSIYNLILLTVVSVMGKEEMIPLVPEFAAHFSNPYQAVFVQNVLIGLISAIFGAGSILMELERLSLLVQSILYFLITTAVWVPVGCFCWGLHQYPQTMLSMGISYAVTYAISWIIQYRLCKKNVEQINEKLAQLREEQQVEHTE